MLARRMMSTTANAARLTRSAPFPERGIAHGGHPHVLQAEPNVAKQWFNARETPEIVPVAACVLFACGLASYKMGAAALNRA
jgi:hypothetical protein